MGKTDNFDTREQPSFPTTKSPVCSTWNSAGALPAKKLSTCSRTGSPERHVRITSLLQYLLIEIVLITGPTPGHRRRECKESCHCRPEAPDTGWTNPFEDSTSHRRSQQHSSKCQSQLRPT